jgi:hypothetical protein
MRKREADSGGAEDAELLALQRARRALRTDAARVADALTQLVESDTRFVSHAAQSGAEYDAMLLAASQQAQAIAARERFDSRVLWWSFAAFFAVVAMIWNQRIFDVRLVTFFR